MITLLGFTILFIELPARKSAQHGFDVRNRY